jgi:hypothetical protein
VTGHELDCNHSNKTNNGRNKMFSNVILVNNTGADLSKFENEFISAVRNGGNLPEELADLFTLNIITVEDGLRGILDFA